MIRRLSLALAFFATAAWAQSSELRTVHVFVALADNQHQGIVPVAPILGNGDDPQHNLYWGSAYGVKSFFERSPDWKIVSCMSRPKAEILERCVFKNRLKDVYLIADAYRGLEIKQAILEFLEAAAGDGAEKWSPQGADGPKLPIAGSANLVAYVGHDGLMDFQLSRFPQRKNAARRDVIILACASKQFFGDAVQASGAYPLIWTTGLMAPEAYTLKSALDGWIAGENNEQVRDRAAGAYDKYQKCGFRAAHRLLTSGW